MLPIISNSVVKAALGQVGGQRAVQGLTGSLASIAAQTNIDNYLKGALGEEGYQASIDAAAEFGIAPIGEGRSGSLTSGKVSETDTPSVLDKSGLTNHLMEPLAGGSKRDETGQISKINADATKKESESALEQFFSSFVDTASDIWKEHKVSISIGFTVVVGLLILYFLKPDYFKRLFGWPADLWDWLCGLFKSDEEKEQARERRFINKHGNTIERVAKLCDALQIDKRELIRVRDIVSLLKEVTVKDIEEVIELEQNHRYYHKIARKSYRNGDY